jgi:antimicrobial peptide system SdpB family protein
MNPLRAWNRFWFGPISARPLGAFRIVFGLLALANLALLAFDIDYWFSNIGLLLGEEARAVAGPLRPSPLQWVQDPTSIRVFFGATSLVCLLFTIGWQTRVMGVLFYLMMLSIHHRDTMTNSGADTLLLLIAFYLMLSPCGAAYSLDARREARRRGTLAEPLIVPWAPRLLQIQLSLIYFTTAILKCNGANWLNGTAMHYVLNNTEIDRFNFSALTHYPLLINLMTYGAVIMEFFLVFGLWFRPTRRVAIFTGLALHTGILMIINIPIFGELMVACYLPFLSIGEFDTMLGSLDPRTWLGCRPQRVDIPGRVDGPALCRDSGPLANASGSLFVSDASSIG